MTNPPPPPPPAGGGFPVPPPEGFPPPGGPGDFGAQGWSPSSRPRPSGMALASMILGIIGTVTFFLIVPSIVAFILGLVAASQIKNSRGQLTRLGMARAGWILGLVGILGFAAFVVAVVLTADETKNAFDLEPGDCVEIENVDSTEVETIDTLPILDCDEPHTGEVVGVVELNPDRDRDYPSDIELFSEAHEACQAEFADYAGTTLEGTDFDLYPIVTQELAWRGERGKTICIAVDIDGADLTSPIGN